ncbi:MAG: LIC12162 family protein [Methylococcaceae bacterium]
MNEQTTLITTEIEETWPADGKVLFLGEWCRLHARRQQWQKLEGDVQTYHWDDRKKLKHDFDYLQGLNQALLLELVPVMNALHHVSHDTRYWRLILGYWLNNYTAVLFDRWSSIEMASNAGLSLRSYFLPTPEGLLVANDTSDFIRQATEDPYWNHALFKLFINQKVGIVTTTIKSGQTGKGLAPNKSHNQVRGVFKMLAKKMLSLHLFLKKNDRITMMSTYLPLKAAWWLDVKFGQIPSYWNVPEVPAFSFDATQRRWQLRALSQADTFEVLARQFLPQLLPKAFVEGYGQLTHVVDKLPWPSSPRMIWTSNYHFSCDLFKFWAAKKCAHVTRLVIGEHGGLGTGAFNGAHSYEVSIADRYLSTGWSDAKQTKIIPIGNFRQVSRLQTSLVTGPALLVCGIMPRYGFDVRAMMLSSQVIGYLDDQFRFVDALPYSIKKDLLVRLVNVDYGWDQKARWEERHPSIALDSCTRPIWKIAKGCRLFIATYNATTYIESLSLNFPTVIFWDPQRWEVKDEASPFFEDLKQAGIFHETPESAARHIASIWDDVTTWWQSNKVQTARARFCDAYASNPPDILDRIEAVLREEARISEASIG